MSDTYSTYVTKLAALIGGLAVTSSSSAAPFDAQEWNDILPGIIDYAEGRIYRDPNFDFLTTYGAQNASCTINNRNIVRPTTMLIVSAMNIISPAPSAPDALGSKRIPLERATLAFLDATWPSAYDNTAATVGVPQYYAPLSDTAFRLAPTPNAAFVAEFVGTTRPVALSSSNTTTFLTLNFADLFLAASMIFASGMMKNFGSQADNPQQAQSWENQFQILKTGAAVEEARRKSQGAAWTTKPPPPIASPPRS